MFLPFSLPPAPPPADWFATPIAIVRPLGPTGAPIQPDGRPQRGGETVEIKLISDTGPQSLEWRQQFSVTINQGGSLAEAANRLWGDPSDENVTFLFEAARNKYPSLTDPGRLTAGQQFTVEIDPTKSFILAGIERLTNPDRTVRKFTNGAVETRYTTPQRGISRVIDFPATIGDREFEFHDGKESIPVPAGSTLVNYEYQAGQTLEEVVQATYGQRSVAALADFSAKTGWRPQNWPPEPGTSKQIIVSRQTNYADEPINALRVTVSDAAWQQQIDRIATDRANLGIYPIGSAPDRTHYQVRITRNDVTLDDVAKLLYARPKDHRTEIWQAAGLTTTETVNNESPLLQGANFPIDVPYSAEPIVDRRGNEVRLASGARMVGVRKGLIGYFPSGYREIRYQPEQWLAFLANAYELAWETLRDRSAPREIIQQRVNRGVAEILWRWDPSNSLRAADDVAESVTFQGGRPGRIAPADIQVSALLKPADQVTSEERLKATLSRFPFLIPVAGLFGLFLAGMIFSLIGRAARGPRAPRPAVLRRRTRARLRPSR